MTLRIFVTKDALEFCDVDGGRDVSGSHFALNTAEVSENGIHKVNPPSVNITVNKMYLCSVCGKSFTRSDNLRRHQKTSCRGAAISFEENVGNRQNQLSREEPATKRLRTEASTSRAPVTSYCAPCNMTVVNMASHQRTLQHRTNACAPLLNGVQVMQSAYQSRIVSYRVSADHERLDYTIFFNEVRSKVINLLQAALIQHTSVKVNMEVFGSYLLQTQDRVDIKSFNTPNKILCYSTDLDSIFDILVDKMISQTTEF